MLNKAIGRRCQADNLLSTTSAEGLVEYFHCSLSPQVSLMSVHLRTFTLPALSFSHCFQSLPHDCVPFFWMLPLPECFKGQPPLGTELRVLPCFSPLLLSFAAAVLERFFMDKVLLPSQCLWRVTVAAIVKPVLIVHIVVCLCCVEHFLMTAEKIMNAKECNRFSSYPPEFIIHRADKILDCPRLSFPSFVIDRHRVSVSLWHSFHV